MQTLVPASRQLVQELGREPTSEELAHRLDIPAVKVRKALKIAQQGIFVILVGSTPLLTAEVPAVFASLEGEELRITLLGPDASGMFAANSRSDAHHFLPAAKQPEPIDL